jgi:hypothetical protein
MRGRSTSASQHLIQEIEANRFAIELLAPSRLLRPYLSGIPDLAKVLELADGLGLSREAAARRYVELHRQPTALVFGADGVVRYVERHSDFPFVSCRPGQPLLALPPLSLPALADTDAQIKIGPWSLVLLALERSRSLPAQD